MKKFLIGIGCLLLLNMITVAQAVPEHSREERMIRGKLEALKDVYSAEIVMGTPLEVNGLKLIPVATAGVGYGQHQMDSMEANVQGVGGVMNPVGIIVVSGQDVRLLQFSKSFMAEVVEILVPVALQALNMPAAGQDAAPPQAVALPQKQPKTEIGSRLTSLYYRSVIFFSVIWLAFGLIVETFRPQIVTTITSTLQQNYARAAFIGLAGYGIVFLFSLVFAVTLIGLPFSFILMTLCGLFTLFGSLGIAMMTGQRIFSAFEKTGYSNATILLIGGGLLLLMGLIPFLGWLLWGIIGMLSFGAVLQIQWQKVKGIDD